MTFLYKNKNYIFALAAILLFVFLIYLPGAKAPFYYDDYLNIVDNDNVHFTPSNILSKINQIGRDNPSSLRPFAYLSFGLNYYFSGLAPFYFRLINILTHVVNSFLVMVLATLLTTMPGVSTSKEVKKFVPISSAMLFAVHPVATQSVTYIVQRMNSMMTMFYLLAAVFMIKAWMAKKRAPVYYCLSILSIFVAMGFKEIAVTFPFVMMFIYASFYRGFPDFKSFSRSKVSYAAYTLLFAGITMFAYISISWNISYNTRHFNQMERVMTQFRIVSYYFGLYLYPHPDRLRLYYNYTVSKSFFSPPTTFFGLMFILSLVFLIIYFFKKDKIISFGLFWPLFNLIPESTIISLDLIYEHRLYLPSAGISILVTYLIYQSIRFCTRSLTSASGLVKSSNIIRIIPWVAIAGVLVIFSWWTYSKNSLWATPLSFWADNIEKEPGDPRSYHDLSIVLINQDRINDAIPYIIKGLSLNPSKDVGALLTSNLALCYIKLARYAEAGDLLEKSLVEYEPTPFSLHNLGVAKYYLGRREEAAKWFSVLEQSGYSNPDTFYYMGRINFEEENDQKALYYLQKAVSAKKDDTESWNLIGIINSRQQNWRGVIEAVEKVESFEGGITDPRLLFAAGYANLITRRMEKAEQYYLRYMTSFPKDPSALYNLACVYALKSETERSLHYLQKALTEGFKNTIILSDPDLLGIRDTEEFKQLIQKHYPRGG